MATTTIPALIVADLPVSQDAEGRFSLNDLHRAAGGEDRNKPGNWLRSQQAQDLIAELSTAQIRAVEVAEGNAGGTFVARELVYAYAMWISARFHLQVIRAYDALVAGDGAGPDIVAARALRHRVLRPTLVVLDTTVQCDHAGRFSLHDLHRATGGAAHHVPELWMASDVARPVRERLARGGADALAVSLAARGENPGPFVTRDLVHSYAAWVGPEFHHYVIRGFDAIVMAKHGWTEDAGAAGAAWVAAGTGLPMPQVLGLQRQAQRLLAELRRGGNSAERTLLHRMLAQACTALGLAAPALAELAAAAAPAAGNGNLGQGQLPGMGGAAA